MTVLQQGPTFPTLSWYEGIAYCLPTLLAVPSRGMHAHTPALAEPQTLASVLYDQHMRAFSTILQILSTPKALASPSRASLQRHT